MRHRSGICILTALVFGATQMMGAVSAQEVEGPETAAYENRMDETEGYDAADEEAYAEDAAEEVTDEASAMEEATEEIVEGSEWETAETVTEAVSEWSWDDPEEESGEAAETGEEELTEGETEVVSEYETEEVTEGDPGEAAEDDTEEVTEAETGEETEAPLKNGICLDPDGVWRYYENNRFMEDFSDFVWSEDNDGKYKWSLIVNGVKAVEANGLYEFSSSYEEKWYYLKNGEIQSDYDGLVPHRGHLFLVSDGRLWRTDGIRDVFNHETGESERYLFSEGMVQSDVSGLWSTETVSEDFGLFGEVYYLIGGKVQDHYTGLVEGETATCFVREGTVDRSVNGVIEIDGTLYKCTRGEVQKDYCGPAQDSEGNLYYFRNGKVTDRSGEGLRQDPDNVWRYYKEGSFCEDYTGIAEYNHKLFFVTNGVLDSQADGLNLYDNEWYYLSGGQVQDQYDGLVPYDNHWFMVKNGRLDTSLNGIYPYNGGLFLFSTGRLRTDVSGLAQFEECYYLENGQVQTGFTGITYWSGFPFFIRNGVNRFESGLIEIDGVKYYIVFGHWLQGFNTISYGSDGKLYFVKDGIVDTNFSGIGRTPLLYKSHPYRLFLVKNGVVRTDYNGTIKYKGKLWNVVEGELEEIY